MQINIIDVLRNYVKRTGHSRKPEKPLPFQYENFNVNSSYESRMGFRLNRQTGLLNRTLLLLGFLCYPDDVPRRMHLSLHLPVPKLPLAYGHSRDPSNRYKENIQLHFGQLKYQQSRLVINFYSMGCILHNAECCIIKISQRDIHASTASRQKCFYTIVFVYPRDTFSRAVT